MYSCEIFWKKANDYNNFDCYTLCIAKPVVGTSENIAETDYDIIKMAAISNFNTNLLCFIISIKVGRFQSFRYQMFKGKSTSKMADILNLNKNSLCVINTNIGSF